MATCAAARANTELRTVPAVVGSSATPSGHQTNLKINYTPSPNCAVQPGLAPALGLGGRDPVCWPGVVGRARGGGPDDGGAWCAHCGQLGGGGGEVLAVIEVLTSVSAGESPQGISIRIGYVDLFGEHGLQHVRGEPGSVGDGCQLPLPGVQGRLGQDAGRDARGRYAVLGQVRSRPVRARLTSWRPIGSAVASRSMSAAGPCSSPSWAGSRPSGSAAPRGSSPWAVSSS